MGCASNQKVTRTASSHAARDKTAKTQAATVTQEREVERLQTQLALSEAENRSLRDRLSTQRYRRETVRIGGTPEDAGDTWIPAPVAEGPRPVLRLYGEDASSASTAEVARRSTDGGDQATWELAERLPPLSVSTQKPEPILTATVPVGSAAGGNRANAVERYREALSLLHKRQFGSAVRAFDRFLVEHGSHPYADNALYWKGEALYAQRQYDQSARTFELLLKSFPGSSKIPDALLKLGMSQERLGKPQQAARLYAKLQKDYPTSVAAQRAPRRNR